MGCPAVDNTGNAGVSDTPHAAPGQMVPNYQEQLRAMQQEWCRVTGHAEVPPVAILPGSDSPHGVKMFAWPSPWLH